MSSIADNAAGGGGPALGEGGDAVGGPAPGAGGDAAGGGGPALGEGGDAAGGPAPGAGGDATGENVSVPMKIRKARQGLRDVDEAQFTPVNVSIGAYHRGLHSNGKSYVVNKVCPRGRRKWDRILAELTTNQLTTNNRQGKGWYPDIDESVMEDYDPSTLLYDGCYVLHFLVEYYEVDERGEEADNPIKDPLRDGNENSVMRDILFLLENQVPWSVLRGMHGCIRDTRDPEFVSKMARCFGRRIETDADRAHALALALDQELALRVKELLEDRLYTISGDQGQRLPAVPSPAPAHLLHLVHHYLEPMKPRPEAATSSWEHLVNIDCYYCNNSNRGAEGGRRMARWRRATEYRRYAFVHLKRGDFKKGKVESVLDVRLDGGTLLIPTLRIDELTCTLLRNLIAFEDVILDEMSQRPVTAYCLFMSQLACKVEDVELLQRLDILQNLLSTDEDVVQAFANICKGVVLRVDDPQKNYLNATWHELHKRCRSSAGINTFLGLFVEKHCSNSVHTCAFIAAFVLFLLQAAQVAFAVLSYLHQPKK